MLGLISPFSSRYQQVVGIDGLKMINEVVETLTVMDLERGIAHRDVSFDNLVYDEHNGIYRQVTATTLPLKNME